MKRVVPAILSVSLLAGLASLAIAVKSATELGTPVLASPVAAPTPPREEIRHIEDVVAQIEKEAEPVQTGRKECQAKDADLATEEKRLIATADLLRGAAQNFKADLEKQIADARAQNASADRHNANRCTYPEGHPEVCAAYNEEARQITEWGRRVNDSATTLEMRRKGLRDRQDDLSRGTLDWAQRKKANNAALEDLDAKEKALIDKWRQRLGLPQSIKTLEDLKRSATMCIEAIRACVSPRGIAKPCSDEQLEAMKYCTNIQWDSDIPGRPPLRNPRPSSRVTPRP